MTRNNLHHRRGSVGLAAAMFVTSLLAGAGYASDHAGWVRQRMAMQTVADKAAFAAAGAYIGDHEIAAAAAATERCVTAHPIDAGHQPNAATQLVGDSAAVRVTLTAKADAQFASAPTIEVQAIAALPASRQPKPALATRLAE